MTRVERQRGFSLMELMTASLAMGVIILAGTAFMLRALSWYDDVSGKIEINRHVRTTYDLWAYGGRSASNGKDNTKNVYGFRGSQKTPKEEHFRNSTGAVGLGSNELTLSPDRFATMSVKCNGNDNPIPDCTGSSTKSVTGWLGDDVDVEFEADNVGWGWDTVRFTITNPYQAQRANAPAQFTETYQTIFTHNRTEDDPA